MPVSSVQHPFNSYKIWYYSAPQYAWAVNVLLYDHNKLVGKLLFMKPGKNVPKNYERNGLICLHYPLAEYENIMRIFRDEEPLFIQLVPENGIGFVGTSEKEPIGEGEFLADMSMSL